MVIMFSSDCHLYVFVHRFVCEHSTWASDKSGLIDSRFCSMIHNCMFVLYICAQNFHPFRLIYTEQFLGNSICSSYRVMKKNQKKFSLLRFLPLSVNVPLCGIHNKQMQMTNPHRYIEQM